MTSVCRQVDLASAGRISLPGKMNSWRAKTQPTLSHSSQEIPFFRIGTTQPRLELFAKLSVGSQSKNKLVPFTGRVPNFGPLLLLLLLPAPTAARIAATRCGIAALLLLLLLRLVRRVVVAVMVRVAAVVVLGVEEGGGGRGGGGEEEEWKRNGKKQWGLPTLALSLTVLRSLNERAGE